MRLPRNAYAFRLYSGRDASVYQVVGPLSASGLMIGVIPVNCNYTFGLAWCRISWLRGSARTLADALVAEAKGE